VPGGPIVIARPIIRFSTNHLSNERTRWVNVRSTKRVLSAGNSGSRIRKAVGLEGVPLVALGRLVAYLNSVHVLCTA
jgi:hypothetical protein